MNKKSKTEPKTKSLLSGYDGLLREVSGYLADARRASARAVNSVITTTYWMVGRRIVEFEQGGSDRATYGDLLLKRLSEDLTARLGKGFGLSNLKQIKKFYLFYPSVYEKGQTLSGLFPEGRMDKNKPIMGTPITQTPSARLKENKFCPTLSGKTESLSKPASFPVFKEVSPLSWSHYVRLLSVENPKARTFYETEALRGGWSVRQLDRQISTLFYERTAMSKDKSSMLRKGGRIQPGEETSPEEELKDPYMLEFLGLKDEYSENDMEEALVRNLENFLMELGGDFAFVGRQKRLRVGNEWYRVDLVFFHRKLRCLVVIDLKIGKFTHADAGQMHMYLNYARAHWVRQGENPPVGLILCAQKDEAVAQYALEGLPNKVMAAEYRMVLPDEDTLAGEIMKTQRLMEKQGLYQA